jgi:hypothetical protein
MLKLTPATNRFQIAAADVTVATGGVTLRLLRQSLFVPALDLLSRMLLHPLRGGSQQSLPRRGAARGRERAAPLARALVDGGDDENRAAGETRRLREGGLLRSVLRSGN